MSQSLRKCLATGRILPKELLVRFVIGPDQQVVADLTECLPGRGLWLSAEADVVNRAVAKGLFSKAARCKVYAMPELSDNIAGLLRCRCIEFIGLARRAGQAVSGFEKVSAALRSGKGGTLLAASDASQDSLRKVKNLAHNLPILACLDAVGLGAAFGRDRTVHGLLLQGRLAERLRIEGNRLAGFLPRVGKESGDLVALSSSRE